MSREAQQVEDQGRGCGRERAMITIETPDASPDVAAQCVVVYNIVVTPPRKSEGPQRCHALNRRYSPADV